MERSPIRVFLVEDDPKDILLIRETLEDISDADFSFKLECADNLKSGLDRIGKSDVDVVLLDLSLAGRVGLEAFVKVHQSYPEIPIVVLTRRDDKLLGLEALCQGAQDYIVKGRTDGKTLTRVIRCAIERNRLQSELRSQSFVD